MKNEWVKEVKREEKRGIKNMGRKWEDRETGWTENGKKRRDRKTGKKEGRKLQIIEK